jgi:O-antigen ligase
MIGVITLGALTPFVMASFERRFEIEGVTYDERGAFTKAASMMISDYPWGVGASHYVLVANVDGYNNVAGVAPVFGSSSTNVHNVYLLVAAETGYFGLIAFVLAILAPAVVAFRCAFSNLGDERCPLLIGLGVASTFGRSMSEW